ncbi:MAG: iron ABC transporter permease [Burkholderiales bacterium]|nr:iron ABC transporter permease [Burkholderiales bacterium]
MARALRIWLLLALAGAAALAAALATGPSPIGLAELPRLLMAGGASPQAEVLHQLRLPRALAAFGTGGLLALAGALMQVLLRNPLADPYVLGISGGSAVGALAAMLLGLGALAVQGGAFGGALLAIVLVFALAPRALAGPGSAGRPQAADEAAPRLLLTGVVLGVGWSAAIMLMLALAPEARVRGMLFWLSGDLGGSEGGGPALGALALAVALTLPISRELNLLLRGPVAAAALGVRVGALRRAVYAIASLATAVAVTTAGGVGFVGLLVPHALRLVIGNDQRVLLPACALGGGTLLLLADTLARTVLAPQQLPVGVVMALLGVPAFLALLARGGRAR